MLTLPDDWRRVSAGRVATRLLRQAEALGKYRAAARLLARACVELLWNTRFASAAPTVRFEERVIRVNDVIWLIADEANDSLLVQVAALAESARELQVVSPTPSSTFPGASGELRPDLRRIEDRGRSPRRVPFPCLSPLNARNQLRWPGARARLIR